MREIHPLTSSSRLGAGQVVQLHWGPPLEVLGAAVGVRFYLLITSLQPLRVHLHSHAEVTFRLPAHRGYGKVHMCVSGSMCVYVMCARSNHHDHRLLVTQPSLSSKKSVQSL